MKPRALFALVGVYLLTATAVASREVPPAAPERPGIVRQNLVLHGGNAAARKTVGDTVLLMGPTGSGAPYLGDFEAGWNGWTSVDLTQVTETRWQVSDYQQAVSGNLAAWCGSLEFAACDPSDAVGGYGNGWVEILELRLAVADPALSATVRVTATLQNDTEPNYDFTYLSVARDAQPGYVNLRSWDGQGSFAVDDMVTYLPAELVGGSDVVVAFRFLSDPYAWSDEDCVYPTAGACQVDDITVTVSQVGQSDIVSVTDFQDGTFGAWQTVIPPGVGDFAALWSGLYDSDPCAENVSQQVAFVDDGLVVPGTGGSECINWCYGPSGFIVNTTGGLAGPDQHLHNSVRSPIMTWPDANLDGVSIAYDVFRHSDFTDDDPGIYYFWGVRSADTDNSAGLGAQAITEQPFLNRGYVYDGGPEYVRDTFAVQDLVVPGRDVVQVELGVYEIGWLFSGGTSNGDDGYPAPYFDNVAVKTFIAEGPILTVKVEDLAQDNFPEIDALAFADLSALHVRFDAARNISPSAHLRNDPGDSIVVEVKVIRAGAVLVGAPQMHYIIDANPLFDDFRTMATSGAVAGVPALSPEGVPVANRWAFDLPDTGGLFPGDVMHYFFSASDQVGGAVETNFLPADLAGYGVFDGPLTYDPLFMVRALPSLRSGFPGIYRTPEILLWDDSEDAAVAASRYKLMLFLGARPGRDFDFYFTHPGRFASGNGLGGRTAGGALAQYTDLIYGAGDSRSHTLSEGDFQADAGDDIAALTTWLDQGAQGLFLTGDGLASDLHNNQGAAGQDFLNSVMGLSHTTHDLRAFIGNQAVPLVVTTRDDPDYYWDSESSWRVLGACPKVNEIDGVAPLAGAVRLAEFTDPNGVPGAYSWSAETFNASADDRIVSMPYDLLLVGPPEPHPAPYTMLFPALVLGDVLRYLGQNYSWRPPVPETQQLAFACYPNPFNPATRLEYTIPAPGHLSLKIYDVRGALVRTLLDDQVQAGGHVMWDGTDNDGAQVSSGVYFSEARMGGETKITKMALIR